MSIRDFEFGDIDETVEILKISAVGASTVSVAVTEEKPAIACAGRQLGFKKTKAFPVGNW